MKEVAEEKMNSYELQQQYYKKEKQLHQTINNASSIAEGPKCNIWQFLK